MRTTVDDLKQLRFGELVAAIEAGLPAPADLSPEDWRLLIAMVGVRLDSTIGADRTAAAYDQVLRSAVAAGAVSERERIISQVVLSTTMMYRFGADPAVEALNPAAVVQTVLRAIPMPFEQARAKAGRWRTLELERIRDLRHVKNLLRPVAELGDDPALQRWLDLLPQLP